MEYPFYNIIWSWFYWQVKWLLIKTRRYTEKNVLRLRSMSPFCTSRSQKDTLRIRALTLSFSWELSSLKRESGWTLSHYVGAEPSKVKRKKQGRNTFCVFSVVGGWGRAVFCPFFTRAPIAQLL